MADCAMSHGGMSHAGRLVVIASPLGMIKEVEERKKGMERERSGTGIFLAI